MGLRKRPYNESKKGGKKNDSGKNFGAPKAGSSTRKNNTSGSDKFSKPTPAKRTYKRTGEESTERSPASRTTENKREFGKRTPFKGARKPDGEKRFGRTEDGAKPTRFGERTRSVSGGTRSSQGGRSFDKSTTRTSGSGYGARKPARKSFGKPDAEFKSEDSYAPKGRTSRTGKPYMVKGAKARDIKAKSEEQLEAATPEIVRLNRYISNAGICSRREADDLIAAGLVMVNGEVVTEMGFKVKPGDEVRYNNERLSWEKKVYLVMNKPKDTITSSDDPEGRKIIMDLVKDPRLPRVYPVGRLDRNTTGVILLTNDGELAQRLTHPKYNVNKIYKATLNKNFLSKDLHELAGNGVELEDGPIKPDAIGIPSANEKDTVLVQIHSGRNRIIHRMFEAMGYLVDKLDRLEFAGIERKGLDRGEWRHLDEKEIKKLKKLVQLK